MSSLDRILPFLQPIAHLLTDASITEVMVNAGGRRIWFERDGELHEELGCELSDTLLRVAIKNIARTCGEEVSESRPILDARLSDGSRVAAMFPPCAVDGPTLTIRLFGRRFSLGQLVELGTLTDPEAYRLLDTIRQRRNILISGGTGTGKTTLLNALAAYIPVTDRIALIEETSEIHITDHHLIRFEARRPEAFQEADDPRPAVTIGDLLRASLRHRPDRIILGEVRGAEAFDLLQAWNTGHQGSFSTIHANSAPLALVRLARCATLANAKLTPDVLRDDIHDAVQLVVHIDRVGPLRKVTEIYAVPPAHLPDHALLEAT